MQSRKFCREFRKDLNATRAAIRAGYSKRTAREQGSRLLTFVNIQKEIAKLTEQDFEEAGVKAVEVIRELKKLGFSNIKNYLGRTGKYMAGKVLQLKSIV